MREVSSKSGSVTRYLVSATLARLWIPQILYADIETVQIRQFQLE